MTNFFVEGTANQPTVNLDADEGLLEISGRSHPDDSFSFYKPIIDWIKLYAADPRDKTIVNIRLEYMVTSSSKCILIIIKELQEIFRDNFEVIINWYFEEDDENIREAGEDYRHLTQLPFNLIRLDD